MGVTVADLADDQRESLGWSLKGAQEIRRNAGSDGWTSRWLAYLKVESARGFHPALPTYGFGDPTSVRLIGDVVKQTSACGAVRHGAECFNYYFPQELDDEYLVVWQGFEGVPWVYKNEQELREFLIERVRDGFSFPLNPVWPIRDPGWYEVLAALRASESAKENLKAWYPGTSILEKIDAIHEEFPDGFCEIPDEAPPTNGEIKPSGEKRKSVMEKRGSDSESNIDMTLHMLQSTGNASKPSRITLKMTSKPSSWLPTFGWFRRKKKDKLLQ
jgi:hypothetical protein